MPRRNAVAVLLIAVVGGCGGDDPPVAIAWGDMGPLAGDAGRGGFRFGAASAATQIEDLNPRTDWWAWTAPEALGGMAKGEFVADAVQGYTRAMEDVGLVDQLGLDSYRFSIEWARIEPNRDEIDETAIAHYREQLLALKALGIRPLVTLHHFSNPVWVGDPRAISCAAGPTDTNLCGYGSAGGAQIVEEMREHAALIGLRFGD
ncbi:MAG: glycoside hydrolase family 1 protein, partial [Deltaproteobacteria bacterium]|nr:glycoside hydrolase family 1 protein [Deltaproteobacteria bacterium]